jgi:hypothetical protein
LIGEITTHVSLPSTQDNTKGRAVEHSAYGFHLNEVIAKRLGISAGDS